MTLIRMRVHMQGGRYDGREWPNYNQVFDVPEWEAEDLIKGGNADPIEMPELIRGYDVLKAADPDFEKHLRRADGADIEEEEDDDLRETHSEPAEDFDDDFDRDEEDAPVVEVKQPYANANKDSWIEFAVSKGADRKQVAELTKAQIISRYGN